MVSRSPDIKVGITRTPLALAWALKEVHKPSSAAVPLSKSVPSPRSENTNGLTSVSLSKCGKVSVVPVATRQYGIQPVTSSFVAVSAPAFAKASAGKEATSGNAKKSAHKKATEYLIYPMTHQCTKSYRQQRT